MLQPYCGVILLASRWRRNSTQPLMEMHLCKHFENMLPKQILPFFTTLISLAVHSEYACKYISDCAIANLLGGTGMEESNMAVIRGKILIVLSSWCFDCSHSNFYFNSLFISVLRNLFFPLFKIIPFL